MKHGVYSIPWLHMYIISKRYIVHVLYMYIVLYLYQSS